MRVLYSIMRDFIQYYIVVTIFLYVLIVGVFGCSVIQSRLPFSLGASKRGALRSSRGLESSLSPGMTVPPLV